MNANLRTTAADLAGALTRCAGSQPERYFVCKRTYGEPSGPVFEVFDRELTTTWVCSPEELNGLREGLEPYEMELCEADDDMEQAR